MWESDLLQCEVSTQFFENIFCVRFWWSEFEYYYTSYMLYTTSRFTRHTHRAERRMQIHALTCGNEWCIRCTWFFIAHATYTKCYRNCCNERMKSNEKNCNKFVSMKLKLKTMSKWHAKNKWAMEKRRLRSQSTNHLAATRLAANRKTC